MHLVVDVSEADVGGLKRNGAEESEKLVETQLKMEIDVANFARCLADDAGAFDKASEEAGRYGDVPENDQQKDADDGRLSKDLPMRFFWRRRFVGGSACSQHPPPQHFQGARVAELSCSRDYLRGARFRGQSARLDCFLRSYLADAEDCAVG